MRKKLKVAELVEDMSIYPRSQVDDTHVGHIVEAIEAGIELPLIIVESKTYRIVDGFHRKRANAIAFGEDHTLEVEVREYKDEQHLFVEAMRLNANHGRNIQPSDRVRSIIIAERLGIEPAEIAKALNITVERLEGLKTDRVCGVTGSRKKVVLKMPIRHMIGKTLTKEQAEAVPHIGGNQQTFYVNQLIRFIETDLLDTKNETLMTRLAHLHSLLEDVVTVK